MDDTGLMGMDMNSGESGVERFQNRAIPVYFDLETIIPVPDSDFPVIQFEGTTIF